MIIMHKNLVPQYVVKGSEPVNAWVVGTVYAALCLGAVTFMVQQMLKISFLM